MNTESSFLTFDADEPVHKLDDDKFERKEYVRFLAEALKKSPAEHGLVVGITGPWGSGKTSLKNLLIDVLNKPAANDDDNPTPHIVEFEPWMYSNSNKLVSLLFSEIAKVLSPSKELLRQKSSGVLNAAGATVDAVSNTIDITHPVEKITSKEISAYFKKVAKALDPSNQDIGKLAKRHKQLSKALKKTSSRIIVFIDNLDRLNDGEVMEILQAVKAVGDLPNMVYVLLYDKEYVTKALNKTCHKKGAQYLEKIIQVPVELPIPPKDTIEELLHHKLTDIAGNSIKEIYYPDLDLFGSRPSILTSCVQPYLNTPRDVIRLVNEYQLRYSVLKDDVETDDLLGITCLEVFCPKLHHWIIENKSLLYSPIQVQDYNGYQDRKEKRRGEYLKQELKQPIPGNNLAALEALFPFVSAVLNSNWSYAAIESSDAHRHIYQKEHFDSYFYLSINQNLLHESEFKQFFLFNPLEGSDLNEENNKKIFKDRYFAAKAGKYLNGKNINRVTKVVQSCLKLDDICAKDSFRQCISMSVVAAIINNSKESSETKEQLISAIVQTICQSNSVAAAPTAACLAFQIQEVPPQLQSTDSRYTRILLAIPDDALFDIHNALDKEKWTQIQKSLRDKLKSLKTPQTVKPFSDHLLRMCADSIPYLFKSDNEAYKAFQALRQLLPDNQFTLYTTEALTTEKDENYVMNLSLLQKLITPQSYRAAIKSWIIDSTFRHSLSCDWLAVAAYEKTFDTQNSSKSVSKVDAAKIANNWEKQIQQQ
ncbi:P-loop NTPase fold protein [Bifidobacterium sp. ESL0690]|uniref:KAP family P-loop NTPase fold protein n=1 Tax=Bifidobacterium sp. ESL0690 TaxID=2983214 RepID=UPI0023F99BC0|nr:P-loop NTPase fold protein [Bifidobacterium sp. ESL0690]WEV47563.1 P-loop NTPase fold protein [Bifidobacterium sp. ESL0690]